MSLKQNTKLFLGGGVYIFKNFTAEPGAIVDFIEGSPTYIVVNGSFSWRGETRGANSYSASTLWALSGGGTIQRYLTGTVVAPNGSIVVDTAGDGPAVYGAIFAKTIEIHQGKQIQHMPFQFPWAPALK